MGLGIFSSCRGGYTAPTPTPQPAPNPDPRRWHLIDAVQFDHGYVLRVRYLDCTNFEGVKVMVYEGQYTSDPKRELDPHFADSKDSPIARFRPDAAGVLRAHALAAALPGNATAAVSIRNNNLRAKNRALAAENDELRRRLAAVAEALKSA